MQNINWNKILDRKRMRVIHAILTFLLLLFPLGFTLKQMGLFSSEPVLTTEITAPPDAPVLKIAAVDGFKSRAYQEENGKMGGVYIEVMIEAANRLGMRPEFTCCEWKQAREAILSGEADILIGVENFANVQEMRKTIPVARDKINVYQASGHETIQEIASLAGTKVGLMAGATFKSMYELGCEYVEYQTQSELFLALERGEIDYAISHASIAKEILKKLHLHAAECFELMGSYPSFAVRGDLETLHEELNRVLSDMADDGTMYQLEKKWISSIYHRQSLLEVIKNNSIYYLGYLLFLTMLEALMFIFFLQTSHYEITVEADEKIRKQYETLRSMAKIYISMHLIDMKQNTITEYNSQDFIRECVTDDMDVSERMQSVMKQIIIPDMLESALQFTDFTTLSERMGKKKVISKEFLGIHIGWIRIQFVAVSYDEQENLSEAVFTILSIDQEKEKEQYLIHIANTDELTGLYNRRVYEEMLDKLRNSSLPETLVVFAFDLNGLKTINDTKGHTAGDEMLQYTAQCMDQIFHEHGKVYRIGGDEFMAILSLKNSSAESLKESLLQSLEEKSKKTGIPLPVAIGYAEKKEENEVGIDTLVMLADKRMYTEKEHYYETLKTTG